MADSIRSLISALTLDFSLARYEFFVAHYVLQKSHANHMISAAIELVQSLQDRCSQLCLLNQTLRENQVNLDEDGVVPKIGRDKVPLPECKPSMDVIRRLTEVLNNLSSLEEEKTGDHERNWQKWQSFERILTAFDGILNGIIASRTSLNSLLPPRLPKPPDPLRPREQSDFCSSISAVQRLSPLRLMSRRREFSILAF